MVAPVRASIIKPPRRVKFSTGQILTSNNFQKPLSPETMTLLQSPDRFIEATHEEDVREGGNHSKMNGDDEPEDVKEEESPIPRDVQKYICCVACPLLREGMMHIISSQGNTDDLVYLIKTHLESNKYGFQFKSLTRAKLKEMREVGKTTKLFAAKGRNKLIIKKRSLGRNSSPFFYLFFFTECNANHFASPCFFLFFSSYRPDQRR